MSSKPIMENGSSASRTGLAAKRALDMAPLPPVVTTERVAVLTVIPSMVNGFGAMEQLEPFGPEQVKLIELLNPFSGATERMY